MARQRIETVTSFARPNSALCDSETVSRVVKSANESAAESLKVLGDSLTDLQLSCEYLESIVKKWPGNDPWFRLVEALLEAVKEDIALRQTIQCQLSTCVRWTQLQPILILISELEVFAACRALTLSAIPELAGLTMSHDVLKQLVKSRVS